MINVYGIPNCDTVKKARAWLTSRGIAHQFHDYKKAGVEPDLLRGWVAAAGWEALLNRSGTTFRKLPDADKIDLDEARAVTLMLAQPSMIRRPVVTGLSDGTMLIGFREAEWAAAFT